MIVITDSNIIISELIRPKGQIALIFKEKSKIQFIAPDFLLEEVKNHYETILVNSDLSDKELSSELLFLKKRIQFISTQISH